MLALATVRASHVGNESGSAFIPTVVRETRDDERLSKLEDIDSG